MRVGGAFRIVVIKLSMVPADGINRAYLRPPLGRPARRLLTERGRAQARRYRLCKLAQFIGIGPLAVTVSL